MNDPRQESPSAEIVALTEAFCNGELLGDDWARLEQLLLHDSGTRAWFRRYTALDAALLSHGQSAAEQWLQSEVHSPVTLAHTAHKSSRRAWTSRWPVVLAASLGLVAAVLLAAYLVSGEARVIASLTEATGDVRILTADRELRAVGSDAPLRRGDQVRTSGSESSAVVAYPDGTRMTLVGNASATCGDPRSGPFILHAGTLAALVQPQPSQSPMTLITPTARIEVLGTQFLVEAAADRTDLSVTEGRVRLVRASDGQSVDVTDGKQAAVTQQSKLQVEDIPSLSDSWDVDFENGLPEDWELGEHVTHGLPKGSRGAVKAVRDESDGQTVYVIASDHAWSQGLFTVSQKSHLHMTYMMEDPRWFQMFLVTRTANRHDPRFSANFLFKNFPQILPRQWVTLTIPLTEFEKLHVESESLEKLVPFTLIINSTQPDRGLVIDRIWVEPWGPGKVEFKVLGE